MQHNSMSDKHIFSLHSPHLQPEQNLVIGASITILDNDLWHRIFNVLHLKEGEACILFNAPLVVHLDLERSQKKGFISGKITDIRTTEQQQPLIHLFQGLLKREAMEDCAYVAAQMGVSTMTAIITSKVHRSKFDAKDKERVEKIMIAACEQSKQFVKPTIQETCSLQDALKNLIHQKNSYNFFCDPDGASFFDCLQKVTSSSHDSVNIFVGPEGGFTSSERELLITNNVAPHALTKSILRSQEAVTVCLGAIRSVAR